MEDRYINELKRIMNTFDGRDFIYNFFLEKSGVDFQQGYPIGNKSEYEQGVRKTGIDMLNLLIYHCNDKMQIMLSEQKQKENSDDR